MPDWMVALIPLALVAFFWWRSIRRRRLSAAPRAYPSAATRYATEAVGASFHRRNLCKLYPIRDEDEDGEEEFEAVATLRLDNENKHDDQAVMVLIRGLQVGHLSREDARRFRKQRGTNRHGAEFEVPALVWVPEDEDDSHIVSLALIL